MVICALNFSERAKTKFAITIILYKTVDKHIKRSREGDEASVRRLEKTLKIVISLIGSKTGGSFLRDMMAAQH